MVLHFIFRSMINVELLFVKDVRSITRFIFYMDVQLLHRNFLK
jgi:hypothetical protein